MRFAVHQHTLVLTDNRLVRRHFIVLEDDFQNIIGWTDWHKYLRNPSRKKSDLLQSDQEKRARVVVKFLNYVFFDYFQIDSLININVDMIRSYLNDYGMCTLPDDDPYSTHRSQTTVDRTISYIIDFVELVIRYNPKINLKTDELYVKGKVFSKRKRKWVETKVPAFQVVCSDNGKVVFRDITDGAFRIIMNEIATSHTEILMLAALGAFAGLRPAEACNVRRPDSKLGPGLIFEMTNGEVTDVVIDLSREYVLRSDLKSVGGIKKHKDRNVYPAFLGSFMDCFNTYMKYMEGRPYEAEYGALSVISNGKARTYSSYVQIFKQVVIDCIPKMLASDDPQTVHYGHLLQEHHLGPHIFRHWFSVMLTLNGEDVPALMFYRGDTSPESSLTYLQNKSELERQYKQVNEKMFNYLMWKSEKLNGDTDDKS